MSKGIKTEVTIQPFQVPSYVFKLATVGIREFDREADSVRFHIAELSEDVLNALCDKFREDVLANAAAKRGIKL